MKISLIIIILPALAELMCVLLLASSFFTRRGEIVTGLLCRALQSSNYSPPDNRASSFISHNQVSGSHSMSTFPSFRAPISNNASTQSINFTFTSNWKLLH